MARYRMKPIIKEAFRYNIDPRPDWFTEKVNAREVITYDDGCKIGTLDGIMRANVGDYIVKGILGEIYPCKAEVFLHSYDLLEEST